MRRFQGRVYGVALSLLSDPGLAQDVAEEAFEQARRHADAYDPRRCSVAVWLLRTTRNLAIDALRSQPRQSPDPDVVAAVALQVFGRLPPGQAEALVLAAFHGYTAEEISRSEHIPLEATKTRIRAGLRALGGVPKNHRTAI